MRNILITGGAGFIGCHLTRKLLDEGNKVICIDDFTLGNEENIKDFKENSNFIFIKEDVTEVENILNQIKNENIDILIGTQMVVKGHHFPNVTLVGVIAADSSLNIDDYRANERTFQILTQVARTSRKRKTTRKSNNSKL